MGPGSYCVTVMADTVQLTRVTVTPVSNSRLFSVFQSESEQDEECMGSMGSAAVAVSPFSCLFLLLFVFTILLLRKSLSKSQVKHLNSQVSRARVYFRSLVLEIHIQSPCGVTTVTPLSL